MGNIILWFLVIELLGLICFPLAFVVFKRLPDRGITLSKVMAIVVVSYLYWFVGFLQIVPLGFYVVLGIICVVVVVSGVIGKTNYHEIISFIARERVHILTSEIIFLVVFVFWILVVSQTPAISHTEKPMDFGFLNVIAKSAQFPPVDMWFSGHSINYYYFGHLMMAVLTVITGVPSSIAYNLSVALIPSLVAICSYGLIYNLIRISGGSKIRSSIFALLGPVFVGFIGNLVGSLEFIASLGGGSEGFWDWIAIKDLSYHSDANWKVFPQDHLWWWRSTRVIDTLVEGNSLDYTITEFPFFSFLLGDLHAHMMALPVLIFGLSLSLNFLLSETKPGIAWLRNNVLEIVFISGSIGIIACINIWDLPLLGAIFVAIILFKLLKDGNVRFVDKISHGVWLTLPILIGFVLISLPFYLGFDGSVEGIRPLLGPSTRPVHFFLIWGFFLAISIPFIFRQLIISPKINSHCKYIIIGSVLAIMPLIIWICWVAISDSGHEIRLLNEISRIIKILPAMVLAGISMYLFLTVEKTRSLSVAFAFLLTSAAFFLILGLELFHVSDSLPFRMNTVFKLSYQIWVLLSISTAFGAYWLFTSAIPRQAIFKVVHYGWMVTVIGLFAVCLYYPVGAVMDRTLSLTDAPTLDGLAYLKEDNYDEYQAISMLSEQVAIGNILEAVGDSYSEYGRISSTTGLPTVVNWVGHEVQWRGQMDIISERKLDVAVIYQSNNVARVESLLDHYDVEYVVVGARERKTYGEQGLMKFDGMMQVIYRGESIVIYKRSE